MATVVDILKMLSDNHMCAFPVKLGVGTDGNITKKIITPAGVTHAQLAKAWKKHSSWDAHNYIDMGIATLVPNGVVVIDDDGFKHQIDNTDHLKNTFELTEPHFKTINNGSHYWCNIPSDFDHKKKERNQDSNRHIDFLFPNHVVVVYGVHDNRGYENLKAIGDRTSTLR